MHPYIKLQINNNLRNHTDEDEQRQTGVFDRDGQNPPSSNRSLVSQLGSCDLAQRAQFKEINWRKSERQRENGEKERGGEEEREQLRDRSE